MPNPEAGKWVSNRQKEAESVGRVTLVLSRHFPFSGYDETPHKSAEDKVGIDLVFFPDKKFSDLTGLSIINVQVKSSEAGLDGFLEKGKKINGYEGHEWRERHLVVLNGSWAEETLIADFVGQVGNLMGIYWTPEMSHFVDQLDPYVRLCFNRTISKGLLSLFYREDMYAWVSGQTGGHHRGR